MTKYIINETFHGYNKISVDDLSVSSDKDNLIVVFIDNTCDEELSKYYTFLNTSLKNHNRIILISMRDENKSFKTLASLLITFNN